MAESPRHILVAGPFAPSALERLCAVGRVTVLAAVDETSMKATVADCDALLVRSYAQVTRAVIEQATRLRVIGRGGVGIDNIDIEAARERGVVVVHTPEAATEAVADLTVGLLLSLVRDLRAGDNAVREGRFTEGRSVPPSHELRDLTLGIIGLGRIGRAVAYRCRHGFGMTIIYNDIVRPGRLDFVATPVEKDQLYREADVVSLHVPLTEQTRRLINERTLARFKKGAFLINTARGGVVDSEALTRVLRAGGLAGAALDVTEPEPLPADHALLSAPNTLFTPHVGARTRRAQAGMNAVVEDAIRVLEGEPPLYPAWT